MITNLHSEINNLLKALPVLVKCAEEGVTEMAWILTKKFRTKNTVKRKQYRTWKKRETKS